MRGRPIVELCSCVGVDCFTSSATWLDGEEQSPTDESIKLRSLYFRRPAVANGALSSWSPLLRCGRLLWLCGGR